MITSSLMSASPVSPISVVSSVGSSPTSPISAQTPATSFANSELPTPATSFELLANKTPMERLSDISAVLRVHEQGAADLHLRLTALTARIARLRRKLNGVHDAEVAPLSIRKRIPRADVLYHPGFGPPTAESRCRKLSQRLDIPRLRTDEASLSSRAQWRMKQ